MADRIALGIDLGTTFSVAAQVNSSGLPMVIPNAEGAPTTPSVVLFEGDHVVVGAAAREALASEPDQVVQLVKRHMGSQWGFDVNGVTFGPTQISSLILRKVCQDAAALVGDVSQVAMTVPAYFNESMRLATRHAGELAGVEVLGVVSEPTAAALAFGYERRPSGTVGAVIDLGGGTFDVTVMEYDGPELTVRATGGDAYLGGANFDKILFDDFVLRFRAATGLDLNDPDALSLDEYTQASQDWLARANRAKHDLTVRDHTTIGLQAAGLSTRVDVTRAGFEQASRVLLDEIAEKVVEVVRSAGLVPADVGVVLLVGGSTRIPLVRQRIEAIFGQAVDASIRPDEAVALGAALFAAQRQLELGGALVVDDATRDYLERLTVSDVAAHSLGISVVDPAATTMAQSVVTLLPRNTALPFEATRRFYTMRPGETSVIVPILEGEDADPDLCRRVGLVTVDGLPAGRPARQPVDITMRLDRDGILEVTAADVESGTQARATIVHAHQVAQAESAADAAVRRLRVE